MQCNIIYRKEDVYELETIVNFARSQEDNSHMSFLQRASDHQENDGHYVVFWAQVPFCKLKPN